ncbi:MAG: hypothetical protein Q8P05_03010 [Candidatus Diapherotrites archaeon]|nr:hypothetical protein [Candidatus Diapherotrites archaeon]
MIEEITTVREWGGSWGATISKEKLKKAHFHPGDRIRILILPKKPPLKGMFGSIQTAHPIEKILSDTNREAWDE